MTKTTGYVLLSFVLALGVLTLLLGRGPLSPPAARAKAQPVEVEQPVVSANARVRSEQDLEGLKLQMSRLNAELQKVRTTVSNATGVPADADPGPVLSREEEEQRWLDQVHAINRAFRDEPLRAEWAEEMSRKILTEVKSNELTAGLVVDVHCRSRTCKLELAEAAPARTERGIALMIHKFSTDLPNGVFGRGGDPAAPNATTLYLSQARPEDSVPVLARR